MEVAEKISRQKLHRIGSSHQITLMLEDEDSLVNGNSVNRRLVGFSVKLWIVKLVLFEDVVDGSQQHPVQFTARPSILFISCTLKIKIRCGIIRFDKPGIRGRILIIELTDSAAGLDKGTIIVLDYIIDFKRRILP